MADKRRKINKRIFKREFIGFRRYLFRIILSNIFLVLLPVSILGVLWYVMISNQAEKEFHRHKAIEMNEIVSGITQRIKSVNLEIAV